MMNFMNDNDFDEVGIVGPRFSWCNNKVGGGRILEWLDRCLLNSIVIKYIQVAMVRHIAIVASDHYPIVLKIFNSFIKKKGILKFEDVWISFHASSCIVSKVWNKSYDGDDMQILKKKCKRALKELFFWSKAN
ncbi:hypothetical protein KFK09_003866 [Dendrobium nobile]|uniref:Uncharacterized protein n=1 Tax=Dendrobium nobile TaxID=94219 RepID=A0A8T3C3R9_DENNO|nr:hypothetical protein KFK09_003866 [Dendrobium nobile]